MQSKGEQKRGEEETEAGWGRRGKLSGMKKSGSESKGKGSQDGSKPIPSLWLEDCGTDQESGSRVRGGRVEDSKIFFGRDKDG